MGGMNIFKNTLRDNFQAINLPNIQNGDNGQTIVKQ